MGCQKNSLNNKTVNRLRVGRQSRTAAKCARNANGNVSKRDAAVAINSNVSQKKKRLLLTAAKHALARQLASGELSGEVTMTDAAGASSSSSSSKTPRSQPSPDSAPILLLRTGKGTSLGAPPSA